MINIDQPIRIIVCIKQVPDTNDIQWTENNTIKREGLDSIINPFDLGALQIANNIKRLYSNTEINVVTMGPKQAKSVLYEAITLGADKAYLLCDKRFSGADTLATAYTLSLFIKKYIPNYNLILCGQQAIDGDTAQTPSSLAEKLSINQITNVIGIKEFKKETSVWIKDTCYYKQEISAENPILIASKTQAIEQIPKISDYISAQDNKIIELDAEMIEADMNLIGLKGSPTQVKKAFRPNISRETITINDMCSNEIKELLIQEIIKTGKK